MEGTFWHYVLQSRWCGRRRPRRCDEGTGEGGDTEGGRAVCWVCCAAVKVDGWPLCLGQTFSRYLAEGREGGLDQTRHRGLVKSIKDMADLQGVLH